MGRSRAGGEGGRRYLVGVLTVVLVGVFLAAAASFAQPLARACADEPADQAEAGAEGESGPSAAFAVDLHGQGEGYSAVLYDNTNGLPTSEANAIAETSEGFIWIGSYSGLIRYDGENFERIDSTTGIASVVSVFVDDADRLWVGTNDSGVAVMEQGEYRFFGKSDGLGSLSVRSMAQDANGNVYVATTNGVSVFDRGLSAYPLDDARIVGSYVRELRTGADGLIYGVTMDDGVFTLEDGKVRSFYGRGQLGVEGIVTVLPDPMRPGFVYLGTSQSSVYHGRLDAGLPDPQVIDVSPLAYVKSVESFGGELVVCADNGIGTVGEDGARKLGNVPLDDSVDHAMVDYEGNLWFTSSRQGVMKIVPNQFSDVFARYGLPPMVVNSTCWDGERLFVGADSGLTVLGPDAVLESVPLERAATASGDDLGETDLVRMLDGRRIRSIIRDSRGGLWFSTYGDYGLVRYDADAAAVTCFTGADGMPSSRVRTVCELVDGSVLAVCTGGVAQIEGDRVAAVYEGEAGLDNTEILTASEAPNGDIVLGSDGDGIYVIHDGQATRIGIDEGLASGVVMRVKHDAAHGVFWIVTSNSIAYMSEDYQVTTVRNFPYSNNFDLYENSDGEMWVLSSNGIYVLPTDELLANGEIDPVYYGRDNGLPVIATANSFSALTDDGELYIAGTTGVAKVNIEVPFESVSDVKMAVPYVEADGKPIFPDEEGVFTVPARTGKLTVYPFVFTYSLMNPQVSYRLEGLEPGMTTVRRSELVPIDYTNLGGGDYRFVMQLHDSMGRGNKELAVEMTKLESVHEMLWFRILCVIVLVVLVNLVVALYFRRKTRKIQQKERENRQLVREMTEAFARTIDMKDHYTNGHSSRVAAYTALLTRELGYDDETVERYYDIALLHDIGKIGVPAKVLNKPERLTDEEYEVLKSHAELGYEALKDISIMPELAIGAWAHHERPDGKGYPQGLAGDDIPRVAQIIAVADTFDAMYSTRPYRERMNFERVVSIIREVSGTQLAPDVVDAFLSLVDRGEFRAPDDTGGGSTENIDNTCK